MFNGNQTKGFEVYLEGSGLIGIATVKLPTIKFMTEKLSGAGILGEVEIPLEGVTESMEAEIKFRTVASDIFKLLDLNGKTLEFYGSIQGRDPATGGSDEKSVHVTLKGSPKEADLGTLEVNNSPYARS